MCRLDMILCITSWIGLLPESNYKYLSPASSDHAPMLLHINSPTNSGHKPFRIYNYWMKCAGFQELLQISWSKKYTGYTLFQIICILKKLKIAIRGWSQESQVHFARNQIEVIRNKLALMKQQLDASPLDENLHDEERDLSLQLEHWFGLEESRLKQKSREQWL